MSCQLQNDFVTKPLITNNSEKSDNHLEEVAVVQNIFGQLTFTKLVYKSPAWLQPSFFAAMI